jgi:nucleotide-binding universal stress UspA family protein
VARHLAPGLLWAAWSPALVAGREEIAMKLETILVPLDGSELAESALLKATELCQSSGARLLLLRATEAHRRPGADLTEAQIEVVADAEAYLGQVAERLRAQGLANVETSVWYGPAVFAIVEAARLRKVDLIVMSTHGRSGLGRLMLGSVAESVLRSTTTPILLIRVPEAPVASIAGAGEARPWTGPGVG